MDERQRDEELAQIRRNLTMLTKREMMEITKDAVKELMHEQVVTFGWWSIRTLSTLILGGLILLALYLGGWPK